MADTGLHAFDTPRLHLRPLDERDEALYCALYTSPELMRHIAAPMTLEAAQRSFRVACKQQSPEKQRWIIHARTAQGVSAEVAGLLGLFFDGDSAEIGVMLWPQWQGRGHAAEVILAMAGRAFAMDDVGSLWTRHASDNARATGLMYKLGFRPDSVLADQPAQMRWRLHREDWRTRPGCERFVAHAAPTR